MAIDWSVDRDGTAFPVLNNNGCPKKTILLIIPGLSGGNNNFFYSKRSAQGPEAGLQVRNTYHAWMQRIASAHAEVLLYRQRDRHR